MKKFLLVNEVDGKVETKVVESKNATQALAADAYDYLKTMVDNGDEPEQATTAIYELVDGKNLLIDIAKHCKHSN